MFLRSYVVLTRFNFHVSYEDTCTSAIMTMSLLQHSELSASNLVFRVTEGVFDRFSSALLCQAAWMYLVWSALLHCHWLQDDTSDQVQVMKVSYKVCKLCLLLHNHLASILGSYSLRAQQLLLLLFLLDSHSR